MERKPSIERIKRLKKLVLLNVVIYFTGHNLKIIRIVVVKLTTKKFVYKNISMDSSWEVRIAKLMDLLNIKWERSKKLLLWWYDENNNKRRYHPDFYLPEYNLYLDTKNKYLLEQDSYKIKRVLENNNVNIFVGVIDDVEKYVKSLSMGFESLDFQASKGNSHL